MFRVPPLGAPQSPYRPETPVLLLRRRFRPGPCRFAATGLALGGAIDRDFLLAQAKPATAAIFLEGGIPAVRWTACSGRILSAICP